MGLVEVIVAMQYCSQDTPGAQSRALSPTGKVDLGETTFL